MVLSFRKAYLDALKDAKAADKIVDVQASSDPSEPANTIVLRQTAGSRDKLSLKVGSRVSSVTERNGTQVAAAPGRASSPQVSKPRVEVKPIA